MHTVYFQQVTGAHLAQIKKADGVFHFTGPRPGSTGSMTTNVQAGLTFICDRVHFCVLICGDQGHGIWRMLARGCMNVWQALVWEKLHQKVAACLLEALSHLHSRILMSQGLTSAIANVCTEQTLCWTGK